ncbi:hypothetical protein NBH00_18475 [Paraconexibacter antarcticus]|uniref:Helicase C-terminal domain-containing protein n=1 Tax=Paraconexibacter antarcticus TaxID=2949664 RepID=A0ABY5DQZ4_9ACTN|nr:DEAD/DEAH box helicase [Paraconexibacter antarcticus]UTI63329.1 hypothetical protein NBH00_18475 [Paraconexibacter antarcticus]
MSSSQSVRNADQERIVRHLSEYVRRQLAGEAQPYIERVRPSRTLQLGILPPLDPIDPPPDPASAAADPAPNVPEDGDFGGRPPTMGLDFVITPPADGQPAVEVSGGFSVYVQRYPTIEEQRAFWLTEVAHDADDEAAGAASAAAEQDATNGAATAAPATTPVAADGDDATTGDGDDGTAAAAAVPAAAPPPAPAARRGRVQGMSLFPRYERIDIAIPATLVPLDSTKVHDTIDLTTVAQAAVDARLTSVLTDDRTVHAFEGNQTVPVTALDGDEGLWRQALKAGEGAARSKRALRAHQVSLTLQTRMTRQGEMNVSLTLSNDSVAPRKGKDGDAKELQRDMHLFNCQLRSASRAGQLTAIEFERAPEDFRYDHLRLVWAHGRNAAADGFTEAGEQCPPDQTPDEVRTTTWPLFAQRKLVTNPDLELAFTDLADPGKMMGELVKVQTGMQDFLRRWDVELANPQWQNDPDRLAACQDARAVFQAEADRFDLGLRALQQDPHLRIAFTAANKVFARVGQARGRNIRTWRLFQLVFQVIHLSALRAREVNDPAYLSELDTADVLYFPTGGGKTEAYLGLIAIAMFYDRLRGKKLGITALLRFPLRMLSVQQLVRVGRIVYAAEDLRSKLEADGDTDFAGDPFRLGFFVGSSNTPNRLSNDITRERDSIDWWARELSRDPDLAVSERTITECLNPDCPGGELTLRADVPGVRLLHTCSSCGDMPVCVTDEEVFRYLPAVTVATVDKLAAVGRVPEVSHFTAGPAYCCPDHGYFTHYQPVWKDGRPSQTRDKCLAGGKCKRTKRDHTSVQIYDPVPALQVQDEMHLLQEELGTFNAHYETLFEHLQRQVGTKKPTKLLAATATVERYEAQVRHLYARRACVFPAPGWSLEESFYTRLSVDTQRIYVGAMPMLREVTEFGSRVQALLHREVERLADDPDGALARLGLQSITTPEQLQAELFSYELSLGYVNSKRDGDAITNKLDAYAKDFGGDGLLVRFLSGDSSLNEIAEALRLIEEQKLTDPRDQRLRANVGTSVVSHGVDLDRLNLLIMNWMPSNIAAYIQATSRSGRLHVGLVVSGYDRIKLRDRSMFHYFLPHHRFLQELVAPVPVNRFAKFAIGRTAPGLITAIILQGYGRPDRERGAPAPLALDYGKGFVEWWNTEASEEAIVERVFDALGLSRHLLARDGSTAEIYDPGMVETMRQDVRTEITALIQDLKSPRDRALIKMLNPPPLTSFRDVDASLGFAGRTFTNNAAEAILR